MPNSGMLDHWAYRPRPESRRMPRLVWMGAWPSPAGYQTFHANGVTDFSRHLMIEAGKQVRNVTSYSMTPADDMPREVE